MVHVFSPANTRVLVDRSWKAAFNMQLFVKRHTITKKKGPEVSVSRTVLLRSGIRGQKGSIITEVVVRLYGIATLKQTGKACG